MRYQLNRRKHKRIRIDKAVRIPVQIRPVFPFVGESVEATLINMSAGGLAFVIGNNIVK